MSNLKDILKRINNIQKVRFTQLRHRSERGGFNKVNFWRVEGVDSGPDQQVRVAISRPLPDKKPIVSDGMDILRKKRFYSPFVHTDWWASSEGNIFEMAPLKDLELYINGEIGAVNAKALGAAFHAAAKEKKPLVINNFGKPKFKLADVRDLFAQVVLGVKALHSHNLSHLDLKPSNILVLVKDGKLQLKICDLTGIKELNPEGTLCVVDELGKLEKLGRKFVTTYEPTLSPAPNETFHIKALDGYGLWTIAYFLYALTEKDPTGKMDDLIQQLYQVNPTKPFNIQKVQDHPFFGDTADVRAKLFNGIQEDFRAKEPLFDQYFPVIPEKNDAFLFLPKNVKHICVLGEQLDNQLTHLRDLKRFEHRSSTQFLQERRRILNSVTAKHLEVKTALAQMPKNKKFDQEVQDLKKELGIIEQEIQLEKMLPEEDIAKCRRISVQQLSAAVTQAVREYISAAQLDKPRSSLCSFFSLHGEEGKIRANELCAAVQKAVRNKQGITSIFGLIENFLANAGGRYSKVSFKPILMKKLSALSNLPFEQWKNYLSDKPVMEPTESAVPIDQFQGYIALLKHKVKEFVNIDAMRESKKFEGEDQPVYKISKQVKDFMPILFKDNKFFRRASVEELAILFAAFERLPELASQREVVHAGINVIISEKEKTHPGTKKQFAEMLAALTEVNAALEETPVVTLKLG